MSHLALADLERHDPCPVIHGVECRYLCPLPACSAKQQGASHRSFAINTEKGVYCCHRCGASGRLLIEGRDPDIRLSTPRTLAARAFHSPAMRTSGVAPLVQVDSIGVPIAHDPRGLAYVEGRGLPASLAQEAGLRCTVTREGYLAVIFPLRNEAGEFVAAHARAIHGDQKKTRGPKSDTVFEVRRALQSATFAVAEAPFDALSLATCGLPAIAMVGTTPPRWLHRHAFSRTILVATDTDVAGESSAQALMRLLNSFGGRVLRLAPPDGTKDWNEALQRHGSEEVRALLQRAIGDGNALRHLFRYQLPQTLLRPT